ncbi:hypothetical protein A2U01_0098510, partial [Trifolium medium]|nr:hypothetical protein [Trifolium medium]
INFGQLLIYTVIKFVNDADPEA